MPEEALSTTQPRVTCPGCSTSYRLRPRQDSATDADAPDPDATDVDATDAAPAGSDVTQAEGPAAPSTVPGPPGPETLEQPTFEPGQVVAERYRVVRFIAQGGMGEVYEAEDVELLQTVALKTISSRVGEESGILDRFKREIALARTVTHPNVCRIFDLGTHRTDSDQVNFLTMELLRGETLSELLRRRHRLSTAEALPLIEQICNGLDAAHRARVVHRDLKSENVYLEGSSEARSIASLRVVLTDFGVARGTDAGDRFASQVTGLGIVGTPAYMAPEQVENKVITSKADLYSLGIVIYEMVTGHLPFEAESPLTTAVKRLREAPPPPHVHVPDLPAWWEKAILRCLERRPDDRFPDAHSVFQALHKPMRVRRPASTDSVPAPAKPASQVADAPSTAPVATRSADGGSGQSKVTSKVRSGVQSEVHSGTQRGTLSGSIAMGKTPSSRRRTGLWIAGVVFAILASLGVIRWMNSGDVDGTATNSPEPPTQATNSPSATATTAPSGSRSGVESDAGPDVEPDPDSRPGQESPGATGPTESPEVVRARELVASAHAARHRGELTTALRQYRQALDVWRKTDRKADEQACLTHLIGTLLDRGEIADASAQLEAAESGADSLSQGPEAEAARAAVLYQTGRLASLRGELDEATTLHERALELRLGSGQNDDSLDSRLALARLDLDSGLPDRAELLAREALDQAMASDRTAEALRARALVVEALVADGRAEEAVEVLEAEDVDLGNIDVSDADSVDARLEMELARAGLAAATLPDSSSRLETAEMLDRFDRIAAEAAGYGLRPLALRVRLQQARIALERSTERRDEALGRLRVVETEARAAGLLYFADRAKVILEYQA